MVYVIETRMFGAWANTWTDCEEVPVTFTSQAAAELALREYLADREKDGDVVDFDPADYRVKALENKTVTFDLDSILDAQGVHIRESDQWPAICKAVEGLIISYLSDYFTQILEDEGIEFESPWGQDL